MALTTVLGMIPLLQDVFFASMAVTIMGMGGLAFATVLTLLVVPALYAVMFRVPSPPAPARAPRVMRPSFADAR
jgi:multidrug efflux pump subunit AcrB